MTKILVIDDDERLRTIIVQTLQSEKYQAFSTNNGKEAVELAFSQHPDLILCDIYMEEMDGYTVLRKLRENPDTATIPFIIMTAEADAADVRWGMSLGADDFLIKPFSSIDLVATIHARLTKQQAIKSRAEKELENLRSNLILALPHELLTPLNGILGLSQMISFHEDLPPDVIEMANGITHSGNRLFRLIQDFLLYAQIEILAHDPKALVALAEHRCSHPEAIIDTTARQSATAFNRSEDLTLHLHSAEACISESMLGKLIKELVDNAFKFSPARTPVVISMEPGTQYLTIAIKDQGMGMDSECLAEVGAFMQFHRKMHEQQGSGLGLAIAGRLTRLYGGALNIASKPGSGTQVAVRLPLSKKKS